MPTVINNPPQAESSGGLGAGIILGIIVAALIVVALFFMYGWPAIQRGTNINVQVPDTIQIQQEAPQQ